MKCRLSFIFFLYTKFVERVLDVKLDKSLDICKMIKSFIDQQKRTSILENDCVEFSIINVRSQRFIFFRCKEHECFSWRDEVSYHVCLKLFLNIHLLCNEFDCKKIVQRISENDTTFLDVNSMIVKFMSQKNFDFLSKEIREIHKFFWNI